MAENKKKADVEVRVTRFEVPPVQDVLVIGKEAPIGQNAFKKILDLMSPNQYTILPVEDDRIEAIVVRNCFLRMLPEKILKETILSEVKELMCEDAIMKALIEVTITTKKSVSF